MRCVYEIDLNVALMLWADLGVLYLFERRNFDVCRRLHRLESSRELPLKAVALPGQSNLLGLGGLG